MQAVILAGGKGTRLRPFTATLPKPLVPVGDQPIIEVVLRQLRRHGFREVVVSTGHLAQLIESFCGDGRRFGLKVRYVRESEPLSTAGALRLIRGLDRHFLTVNGDLLTDMDFGKLFSAHRRSKALATVGVVEREHIVDFGVVRLDAQGLVAGYDEKPTLSHLVSMGVNAFERSALKFIKPGERLGIPDLIARIREAGKPVRGYRFGGAWLDIGRPADYEAAQDIFSDPKRRGRYLR